MIKCVYLVWEHEQQDPLVICETRELAIIAVDHLRKIDEVMEIPWKHYWWTRMPVCDNENQVCIQLN